MSKPMYVWNGSTWEEVGPVVPQTPIAYQASAPVSPSTGDIWVDSDGDVGTFDRQLVRYRFVASGGETSLSGVDANGFTLAYVPGAEQVYLNGVLLVRTSDYTATNGTSITALSPALAANDVVEVFAYNSFNLANTYTKTEVDGLVGQNKILQVVYNSVSTGVTSATNTYVDTGLTATITPSSASNKILVIFRHGHAYKNNGNAGNTMQMQFLRDATNIGTLSNMYYTNTAVELGTPGPHFIALDEPATTSAVTYKSQFRSQNNTSLVGINGASSHASVTLMEVRA